MRYAVTRRGTVSLAKTEASFQKASSADLLLKVRGSSDRTGTAATRQLTGDLPAISLALRPWTGLDAGRPKAADLKSRSALRTAHSRAPVRHLTDAPARRSGAGRTVSGELDSALPTHPLRLMMRSSIWTCRALARLASATTLPGFRPVSISARYPAPTPAAAASSL